MVPLSFRKPCCQKMSWSELRCIDSFLGFSRDPGDYNTCHDKPDQTDQQFSPVSACREIESSYGKTGTQQRTAIKPQDWIIRGQALLDGPPKSAKEERTEQKPGDQG